MAKRARRSKRRSKAALAHDAEMSHIDERIAVAGYYGDRTGAGDLEDWFAAIEARR